MRGRKWKNRFSRRGPPGGGGDGPHRAKLARPRQPRTGRGRCGRRGWGIGLLRGRDAGFHRKTQRGGAPLACAGLGAPGARPGPKPACHRARRGPPRYGHRVPRVRPASRTRRSATPARRKSPAPLAWPECPATPPPDEAPPHVRRAFRRVGAKDVVGVMMLGSCAHSSSMATCFDADITSWRTILTRPRLGKPNRVCPRFEKLQLNGSI